MYSSTSGALVAQAAVDTIANNLANVNTAGFKRTLLQVQSQQWLKSPPSLLQILVHFLPLQTYHYHQEW